MDLALLLRQPPEQVEELAFADSFLLLGRHYEQEEARLRIDARLHGMEIG